MEVIFGLVCALGLIAVVGHGIWVAAVAVVRLITGESPSSPAVGDKSRECPWCDAPLLTGAQGCSSCGWPRTSDHSRRAEAAILALKHKLKHFQQVGLLDQTVAERLNEQLHAELTTIAAARPTAPPPESATLLAPPVQPPVAPAEVFEAVVVDEPKATYAITESQPGSTVEVNELVAARMETYVRREEERLPPPPPQTPYQPRKPFAEVLVSFLEEKNIRWGELIGGLLIVGSSIALVLSFWNAIAARPLLKFGLFNGITAGLFGLGHYIHRHWKLANTSQGLLIIATLLVPLNFLAITALTQDSAGVDALTLIGEVVSIGVFAALVWWTGTVITPGLQWPLVATVLGCATSQFLIRRVATPEISEGTLWGVALVPALIYAVPLTIAAWRGMKLPELDLDAIVSRFKLLGLATFAVLLALGLLTVRTDHLEHNFGQLAPLLPLIGWPSLLTGLIVWQKVNDESLTGWRTAGTAIAALGAVLSVGAIVLAWPDPASIVAVAALNFVLISLAAWRFDLPVGHVLAAGALACSYAFTMLVLRGLIGWRETDGQAVFDALLAPGNGAALVPLVAILGLAAGLWHRGQRLVEAQCYGAIAGLAAVVSLALVTFRGLGQAADGGAWAVYLIYGLGAVAASFAIRRAELTWAGSTLLLVGAIQAIVYRFGESLAWQYPWLMALLIHAGFTVVAGSCVRRFVDLRTSVARPLEQSSLIVSVIAAAHLVGLMLAASSAPTLLVYWLVLAAIWGLGAFVQRHDFQFAAFQGALTVSLLLATTRWLEGRAWFGEIGRNILDPWSLQTHGLALAGLGIAWVLARHAVRRYAQQVESLQIVTPEFATVDRVVNVATLVLLALLSLYAVAPGTLREVSTVDAKTSLGMADWFERSYAHARGTGAWLFWLAGLTLLVMRLTEGFRAWLAVAGVGVLWLMCPLVAAEGVGATASALRWCCGGFLIVATIVHLGRDSLVPLTARLGWPVDELRSSRAVAMGRVTALGFGGAPIVLISGMLLLGLLTASATQSVAADTFFARIGLAASHLIPLAVLVVALLAMAIRDRVAGHALAAGCVLHGLATLAYQLWPGRIGRDEVLQFYEVWQLNGLVGGVFALGWFVWLRRDWQRWNEQAPVLPGPWLAQKWLATVGLGGSLVLLGLALWSVPVPAPGVLNAAGPLAWCALAVTAVIWIWPSWLMRRSLHLGAVTCTALGLGLLVALDVNALQPTTWLGFHVWQLTQIITAVGLLVAAQRFWPTELRTLGWVVSGVWLMIVLMALRAFDGDPQSPWWASGALVAASAIGAVLAAQERTRWRIVPAALVLNAAVIHAVLHWTWRTDDLAVTYLWNVITLALPCVVWVWIDRRWIIGDDLHKARGVGWHRVAPVIAAGLLVIWTLALAFDGSLADRHTLLTWLAWGSVAVAILATAWDPHTRRMPFFLYTIGLVGVAIGAIQTSQLGWTRFEQDQTLLWTGVSFIAAYSILTSYLWSRRRELLAVASMCRMPVRGEDHLQDLLWLVPANALLVMAVLAGAMFIDFTFAEQGWRLATGKAALLQVVSLGLLARGEQRSGLQRGALVVGALAAVIWAWAWLPHTLSPVHLDRVVAGMLALVVCVGLYGVGLGKLLRRDNEWTAAALAVTPSLVGLAAVGIVLVLGLEVAQFIDSRTVVISCWASLAMIGVFAGLVVMAMIAALVPGRDPLNLSERGRTGYVYAAEVLLGLLFLHKRMTMPWLFHGFMGRYWPLIVMAIAFAGVGASEIFRRQQRRVLYEPFERSAALLPLLPVLGFWVAGSQVHYSWIMVVVGGLYGTLAIMRQSFGYSMLAALAANGGLWYLLGITDGFSITEHPQLWLIPPAVCVLIAAQLNRNRLTPEQLTTIRYLTSSVIYVSSTADIFLRGVREAPWLPLVLGGLSIVGMLLGIALRVRAFLFLGATFLVIALGSIIKYAAVDLEQTWIWAVTGIVTGVLIIALFAVFEKKRNEILAVVDDLRKWEG